MFVVSGAALVYSYLSSGTLPVSERGSPPPSEEEVAAANEPRRYAPRRTRS